MLLPGRTKLHTINRARPVPLSFRQRLRWTLSNLLTFSGIYLLLYVGGVLMYIDYQQQAARGDTDLVLPLSHSHTTLPTNLSASPTNLLPTAMPDLTSAAAFVEGPIASDLPNTIQMAHTSTVERVVIPSIALDYKVVEVGWTTQEVDGKAVAVWDVAEYAIGQHRGSANPGEGGNVVLAGHVGGYGHVFRDLFYVHPGEEVTIYSAGNTFHYVVYDRLIVDEDGISPEQRAINVQLMAPTDYEQITMITCWPPTGPDKFTQRVIVRAIPAPPNADATQP